MFLVVVDVFGEEEEAGDVLIFIFARELGSNPETGTIAECLAINLQGDV